MRLLAILVVVAGLGAAAGSAHPTASSAPIAFTVKDRGITRLYMIQPDGTGLRQLTARVMPKNFLGDLTPAWSPDGRSLVFARNTGRRVPGETLNENLHLFRIAANGGRPTQLTYDPNTFQATPAYAPDGRSIIFTGAGRPGASFGYVYSISADPRAKGSNPAAAWRYSTFGKIFWFGARFSADGKRIAFSETGGVAPGGDRPVDPAAVVLGGTGPNGIPYGLQNGPVSTGLSPSWSPDSSSLAFVVVRGSQGSTCRAHANLGRLLLGLDPTRPAQPTRCTTHGDIYFGELTKYYGENDQSPQIVRAVRLTNSTADDESPSWSPDGTEIAYASGQQHAALMAISVKTRAERVIYRPKRGSVTFVAWAPR